jgi:hypothetical protein
MAMRLLSQICWLDSYLFRADISAVGSFVLLFE